MTCLFHFIISLFLFNLLFILIVGRKITQHLDSLKISQSQSEAAKATTLTTLESAGVPAEVITTMIATLQLHNVELSAKITRWELLKKRLEPINVIIQG